MVAEWQPFGFWGRWQPGGGVAGGGVETVGKSRLWFGLVDGDHAGEDIVVGDDAEGAGAGVDDAGDALIL